MHCGNHHELSSKSLLDSLMMWDFAPVDMQDLALILPSIPLTSGFVPQFALDLSAAGMPNTTTTVSSVQDGLPNGTVRCHGLEHLHQMLLLPVCKAQRPARANLHSCQSCAGI